LVCLSHRMAITTYSRSTCPEIDSFANFFQSTVSLRAFGERVFRGTRSAFKHLKIKGVSKSLFMSTTRVAHFESHAQAESARQYLLKHGINADIHAESGLAKLWFVSRCQAGVRLEVPPGEAPRASTLLHQENTPSGILREAVRCPECHSLRVDFPQFTRKSV